MRLRSPTGRRGVPTSRRKKIQLIAVIVVAIPLVGLVSELVAPLHPANDLAERMVVAEPPTLSDESPTLCIDGPEFMAALRVDLAAARRRAVVQTLSFEADEAGTALAEALIASPAAEKVLLIDTYSRFVVSDKLIFAPTRLLDVPLGKEARRTRRLIKDLEAHGVAVTYGRGFGLGRDNLAARDHKKIIVADDVAYIGGINFSAHNFLWHDMMLRIADADVADMLAADVARSRADESGNARGEFGDVEIVIGAGEGNTAIRDRTAEAIRAARTSIAVECPYITEPYFTLLGEARRRGVAVTIVTSEQNNRLGMKQSIMAGCMRNDLELRFVSDRMTHIKAMLIDDETLVMGSANFDFLSGELQPELVAVIRDPATVADFDRRVRQPSLAESWQWVGSGEESLSGRVGSGIMTFAQAVLTAAHTR